ncbi:TniQ family protein [Ruegeria sp. HKCCA4812]|uniref:TniQ family protein n=1 Tax=Ruegeria sp. HKCCA4812 TaxID=2682993 RepID=UPI001489F0EF|nr:TniQ family protein [Ruegeria sp. HKCCA4812]
MTAPLVLAPPLIEGESLNGYVSRSAQLFGRTPRDFCTDLGMRWPYLCSGHDDQMERLAWLIGESPEKLSAHTAGKVGEGRFKLGQTVVTLGTMRRTAVRLCPQCVVTALTEIGPHGVFQLLEWAVTSLHTCGRYKCYLMTLPPAKHAHTNYDFVARVLDNIDAVQSACMSPETAQQTAFERYIRERIQRGPKNDWLKDLDLTQIHRLCLNLGAAIEGLKMKIMKTLGSQQERSLCQLGFKNVRAGPDGFKVALKRLHRQSTSNRPYFSADMGLFYQWLREYYEDPTLAPLVDLTCDHIFETYPIPTGKEVFDRVAPKQTLLNMHEARKRSGFGVMFLKGLLGHLDGVDLAEANLRTDVRVDELARAQAYVEGLINLEDAARMLGLSRSQIKALQSCGVLDMIKITSSLRYVLRNQAGKLLDKLNGLPTALPYRSVVPLREFCRSKQVTMVQIIDLWVQGELDGKLCRGEGVGLQAIEVE